MVYSLHTLFQYTVTMSSFSSSVKFDIEKFDGIINFGVDTIRITHGVIRENCLGEQYQKKALSRMLAMSLSLFERMIFSKR